MRVAGAMAAGRENRRWTSAVARSLVHQGLGLHTRRSWANVFKEKFPKSNVLSSERAESLVALVHEWCWAAEPSSVDETCNNPDIMTTIETLPVDFAFWII